jgi:glycosyltransferase involved in cell wall biosynthesis
LRDHAHPAIRVVELEHCGNPARVRNIALAAATGRYVAFLDSDDLWKPRKLELQLAALAARPQARWSYTATDRIDADGRLIDDQRRSAAGLRDGWIFGELLRLETAAAMPTVMAERALLNAVEGFDETLPFGEFHDLCLRLALASPALALHEALTSVRTHQEHFSADRIAALASWMRLYEKFSMGAPEPAQRAYSARMRALTAARLAARHAQLGEPRAAHATLRRSLPYSWRYPRWWSESLKTCVKSAPQMLRRPK